jgi:hypothetical protein
MADKTRSFKKIITLLILIVVLCLMQTACLTTAAILKNKTIIKHTTPSMPGAGIAWGYPRKGYAPWNVLDEMGIEWIRVDISWNHLEPEQGEWHFDDMDTFCREAKEKGHKILGILAYDTPWIHDDPKGKREVTPDQLDHYINYVNTVVDRYGEYIDEWEIWNEPNLPFNTFWTGSDEDFYTLSKEAAAAIRDLDPNAVILGGANWRFDKGFIRGMAASGALEDLDVFSFHPYYDKPEKIYDKSRDLEDYLKLQGFRGDFRVTEAGFSTYGKLPTSCKPEEQGRLVLETLVLLGKLHHPYIIWYSLYNSKGAVNSGIWSDAYGLTLRDGDIYEYKTGGWALRRYNELIARSYPAPDKISLEESLEKKVAHNLYWDGNNPENKTLVLFGEKKSQDLILGGFDTARIYNAATGEISRVSREWSGELTKNQPLIVVMENVTTITLSSY